MAFETTCPSCGAQLRRGDGTLPRTAVAMLLGLVAATTGTATCGGNVIEDNSASGTSSGRTGSAGDGSGAGGLSGAGGGGSTIGVGGFGVLYGVGATMQGVAVSVGAGGAGGQGGAGAGGEGGEGTGASIPDGGVAPPYGMPP